MPSIIRGEPASVIAAAQVRKDSETHTGTVKKRNSPRASPTVQAEINAIHRRRTARRRTLLTLERRIDAYSIRAGSASKNPTYCTPSARCGSGRRQAGAGPPQKGYKDAGQRRHPPRQTLFLGGRDGGRPPIWFSRDNSAGGFRTTVIIQASLRQEEAARAVTGGTGGPGSRSPMEKLSYSARLFVNRAGLML